MTDYRPGTIFSPHASIGRRQYLMSFVYETLSMVMAMTFDLTGHAALGLVAILGYLATYAMMTLAIKARLSDAGMSMRWLALPFGYLVAQMLRPAVGAAGASAALAPLNAALLLATAAMTALLLLLMFVPSLPRALPRPA